MTPTLLTVMVGYTVGYALAAFTRTEDGPALYVPLPSRLRRVFGR
jgi:hypothetical protein